MPTDAPITSTDEVLAHILRASPPLPADLAPTLRAWWSATANTRQVFELPIDRALVAGAHADRLGFAFAVGYAEALRALVPGSDGIS
ncbi:MAG TPA: hypothetical protein VK427_11445, partial [Kofleriaceae bacterium]|nr:hypothetical protein [Kofleriaceae bacterium]